MSALDSQATALREVRERGGTVLSVAIVAAGFAAGLALTVNPPTRLGLVGVLGAGIAAAGLAGVVLTAVMIWRPSEERFLHEPARSSARALSTILPGNWPRSIGS